MFNNNLCPKCGSTFYIPNEAIQNSFVRCPHCKKNIKNPAIKKGRTLLIFVVILMAMFFIYKFSTIGKSNDKNIREYSESSNLQNGYFINTNTYGATSKKALDDLFIYLKNNDTNALNLLLSAGKIIEIPAGTQVNVVKNHFSYTIVKILGSTEDIYVTDHLSQK